MEKAMSIERYDELMQEWIESSSVKKERDFDVFGYMALYHPLEFEAFDVKMEELSNEAEMSLEFDKE